jgi:hypothetical protein
MRLLCRRLGIALEFLRVTALFMRRGVHPCSTSPCSPHLFFCACMSPMSASPTGFDRRQSSYEIPISRARVRRRILMRSGSSLRRYEIGPSLLAASGGAWGAPVPAPPACASCQGLSRVWRGAGRNRPDPGDSPGRGARRHPGASGIRYRPGIKRNASLRHVATDRCGGMGDGHVGARLDLRIHLA